MAEYNPSKIIKDGNTYNFRDDTKIPLAGTNALSGSIVPSTDNAYDFGDSSHNYKIVYAKEIRHGLSSGSLVCSGGDGTSNGAYLALYGTNRSDGFQGRFDLVAKGSSDYKLTGLPSGTLTWGSKNIAMAEDVIPRSGGAVMTGDSLGRTDNTHSLSLCGGTNSNAGGNIILYSNAFSSSAYRGAIALYALTGGSTYKAMFLYTNGTWTWDGSAVQITSDQRYKQQINAIDDKLLDAWQDVELCQFKYNDAVDQKKDKARLHTGYVVQQIDEACKSHNVDISEYGLYCHEEYPEETEEVEVEQADGTKIKETKVIREASEHYSLRYTECLVVECAYLRKKNKQLQEQLDKVIARLDKLESVQTK
ncbi:MAG: tail fiber domain-containing protein [Succinivibrionaceae bacterium]|nr:tail fiber domain-containing protein [Succinivibrionaceae bacterium]